MYVDDNAYYLITTNSEYMAQIGLASFTIESLERWWNQKDDRDPTVFVNRNYIDTTGFGPSFSNLSTMLLHPPGQKYYMGVWNRETSKFDLTDVADPSFAINTLTKGTFDVTSIGVNDYETINILPSGTHIYTANTSGNYGGLIGSIIQHNNLSRLKYIDEGTDILLWDNDVTFNGTAGPGLGTLSPDKALQKATFVNAIKASQSGCVDWTVTIPFRLNLNSLGTCVSGEPITFSLRLFDQKTTRSTGKGISFFNGNDPIVATPLNQFGQTGLTDFGGMTPSKPVVGEMDLHYDEATGRFRSGTKQMIGIIAADIEPYAGRAITTEDINITTKEDIAKLVEGQKIPHGLAYPVTMQNSNPLFWAIPFKEENGCRGDDVKKATVKLLNFAKKKFTAGTRVMLTNVVGSWWVPQDFGIEETPVPSYNFGTNWQFNYLMMNRDNYFRTMNDEDGALPLTDITQFSDTTYERAFRKVYYRTMALYYGSSNPSYVLDAAENFDAADTTALYVNKTSPIHITSFDSMGANIGGTRNQTHGISQTNFGYQYNGTPMNLDGREQHGFVTQFFGCIFPAGYNVDPAYSLDTAPQTFKANNDYTDGSRYFANKYTASGGGNGFTSTDAPFAKGKNVNWIGGADGMFDQGAKDAGYVHLPADIVTISRDTPITKIKELVSNHTITYDPTLPNCLYKKVTNYMLTNERFAWLSKNGEAAYKGVTPKNRTQVQFRPLPMELYAQYEANSNDPVGRWTVNPGGGFIGNDVTAFGGKARNKVLDFATNGGVGTYARNVISRSSIDAANPIRYGSSNQSTSLPVISPAAASQSFGCKYLTKQGAIDNYPFTIWNQKFSNEPANAVGVITACCDASFTTSSFPINVVSYIGMSNRVTTTLSLAGGTQIIGNIIAGSDGQGNSVQTDQDYKYWGGTRGVNRFNTTELWLKIYEWWPRDQIVFDPRFFTVHHYNYGISGVVDSYKELTGDYYIKGVKATDEAVKACNIEIAPSVFATGVSDLVHDAEGRTFYGTYMDDCVPYWVWDSKVLEADYRIPTYGGGTFLTVGGATSTIDNTPIPTGTLLYKNSEVRRYVDSIVEPKRRGKLLPFTYYKTTIGIGGVKVAVEPGTFVGEIAQDYDITIKNTGTGYAEGDTFTTTGGSGSGVLLTVDGITSGGKITSFSITNPGESFVATDFLNESDVLANVNGNVVIKPLVVKGVGFIGYINRGTVINVKKTVAKPRLSLDDTLISPETGNGYIINRTDTFTVKLDETNLSPSNKYNVFLHFHNDCSYTMFFAQDYQSIIPSYQQHITVTMGG